MSNLAPRPGQAKPGAIPCELYELTEEGHAVGDHIGVFGSRRS
jgi:hypothetical protein